MSVKEKKRGRPNSATQQLSAERIVGCARRLLAECGKVPSIRQLATELQVDAMAIYHYFANKAVLLEALTLSLLDEIYQPLENANWQNELLQLSRSYLSLLRDHPGLLTTILSMSSFGPAQLFCQRLATALAPLSLNKQKFEQVRDLLADYLHGVATAMELNPGAIALDTIDAPIELICLGIEQLAVTNPSR